jgi:hypothetical protein
LEETKTNQLLETRIVWPKKLFFFAKNKKLFFCLKNLEHPQSSEIFNNSISNLKQVQKYKKIKLFKIKINFITMLRAIMHNVTMPNVIVPTFIMLRFIMPSVIMHHTIMPRLIMNHYA